MEIVFSGLGTEACRAPVGPDFQFDDLIGWRPADTLPAIARALKAGQYGRVIWLYRSPVFPTDGDEGATPAERVHRWIETNRAALNLRHALRDRLVFVNVDRVAPAWLGRFLGLPEPSWVPVDAWLPKSAARDMDPSMLEIAEYLVAWGAPECWAVYEALELVSSGSEGGIPNPLRAAPEPESVLDAVARLATPPAPADQSPEPCSDESAPSVPANDDAFLREHLLELQVELERYYKKWADATRSEELARRDSETVRAESSAVRAESSTLRAENSEVRAEISAVRAENSEVRAENEALRQQLQQLMDQMVALATRAPVPATGAGARPRSLAKRVAGYIPRQIRTRRERAAELAERATQIAALRDSGLLDAAWYRDTYPDVDAANVDPGAHYLEFGWREGRNPGPAFDTRFYLKQYPDVLASGINPLLHYVMHGREEGRSVRPA